MSKANLLNTRTTNFLELLGNGRIYRVPAYQRDYSWGEEQWEDLWNDLVELVGQPDERHYMGAIVVEGKSDREFLIIDGQQRLATLSIFALAVIARLQALAELGTEPEQNRERAANLRIRYVGEKDPASLVESSKLFLNRTDDGFYQDYLVQLRSPHNPRGLPKSNRLLWDCFRYFSRRLEAQPAVGWAGEQLAAALSETVGRQLVFIQITVDDEINAYTVFETLNARGLELSATDLLKNYLFSRVRTEADLAALQRRWQHLMATVQQERFPEFLRYHLLCEEAQIRTQRLFKLVRGRVRDTRGVFELMNALEPRSELYSAAADPNHEWWMERAGCRPFVRELQLFKVRQMMPLLFAAWEKLGDDFESVLRLVTVISFRYTIVSGLNPNALEPVYHDAAKALLSGQVRGPADVFQILRPVYVADEKFQQDFARLTLETTGQRKKLVKYILARLESHHAGHACDPDTDPGSIEHVLPENPTEDWQAIVPREHWETATYRLGNLTLLEAPANRRVGNAAYSEKVLAYQSSGYSLSRQIAADAPDEWTLEQIDRRQKRLASIAAHVWRVDY